MSPVVEPPKNQGLPPCVIALLVVVGIVIAGIVLLFGMCVWAMRGH